MTSDLGFLAPTDDLADWRMVVLTHNAAEAGLLDALPATAAQAAAAAGVHPKSARVLLDALTVFDVVTVVKTDAATDIGDETVVETDAAMDSGDETVDETDAATNSGDETVYRPGAALPDADQRAILAQHAQFIGRWASELPDRLPDPINRERRPRRRPELAAWLRSLGARARGEAPTVIDRVLTEFPEARTVLDVAGGHGEYGLEAAFRGLKVTLLDLPQVIDIVSDWTSIRESGVNLQPGDIFETRPDETFDLVLCFGFTHTQPAERIATVFPLLHDLTKPGGGLAVSTFLRGANPVSRLFAVQMLIAGNGGDSHRIADYRRWITGAGYDEPAVHHHDGRTLLTAARPRS